MGRHQFHSELTCDEVWYRMNVLLRRFSAWGAKRYEVRGELTKWGCFLWLRNPEGPGGTPVPLRLWTEEREGPGCEICCSFRPGEQEVWGMTIAGGGLWLEVLLSGLVKGVPFVRALRGGLLAGGIGAGLVYILFFGLARLFARRRERELLQWIETYLLIRRLDGVLLPDLEVQRAEWAGLPPEEKPVKRRRFAFHSPLPPEELPAALEQWAARRNQRQEGRSVRWSVRRQGSQVKILRTETETGRREGVQAGGGSLGYASGRYKSWQFSNPFSGAVESDGRGGSVLRGGFLYHGLFLGVQAAVLLVIGIALCLSLPLRFAAPLCLIAAVLCGLPVLKNPLNNPGSREILEFLQTYLEEI